MRKQDIEITIGPTGEVSFTIKGVKGSACLDETKFLEDAVGAVTQRDKTSEYYEESESAGVSQWAGEGDE